jgi:Rne/Rng family ribonuclease
LLINAGDGEEVRVALVENKELVEFLVERADSQELIGNIYLARVARVDKRHEAAFVDFGLERDGFVPLTDLPAHLDNPGKLKAGTLVPVQVKREPVGTKGAALTGFISLPGRFSVVMPGADSGGVSRKIRNDKERDRLRDMLKKIDRPEGFGVILRTAAIGQTKAAIEQDIKRSLRLWKKLLAETKKAKSPCLLFRETDPYMRILRDLLGIKIDEVIVDSPSAKERVELHLAQLGSRKKIPVNLHTGKSPLFEAADLEAQIARLSQRLVPMDGGGSIVIDQTEALVAVDVNSGRTKGQSADLVAVRTNLEAARVIAREIRLRDLGGIIEAQLRRGMGWVERLTAQLPLHVANELSNRFRGALAELEATYRCQIVILANPDADVAAPFEIDERRRDGVPADVPRVHAEDPILTVVEPSEPMSSETSEEAEPAKKKRRRRRRRGGKRRSESNAAFLRRCDEHKGSASGLMSELTEGLQAAEGGEQPTSPPEPAAAPAAAP